MWLFEFAYKLYIFRTALEGPASSSVLEVNPVNPTQVIYQPSSTSDTEKHLPHVAEEKLFQTKERAQMAEA